MKEIMRKLPVEAIIKTHSKEGGLSRTLGAFELTMMGVGVIIGSGIFVITGVAAAEHAGPGLILSFALAGIACGCAALCLSLIHIFGRRRDDFRGRTSASARIYKKNPAAM